MLRGLSGPVRTGCVRLFSELSSGDGHFGPSEARDSRRHQPDGVPISIFFIGARAHLHTHTHTHTDTHTHTHTLKTTFLDAHGLICIHTHSHTHTHTHTLKTTFFDRFCLLWRRPFSSSSFFFLFLFFFNEQFGILPGFLLGFNSCSSFGNWIEVVFFFLKKKV